MPSEVPSDITKKKIAKCRWFCIQLKKQFEDEQTIKVCKYLWVMAKSMSKKATWTGCNFNKSMDGFISMVYFHHPVNVGIFQDLIRDTWKDSDVRPILRTDGPLYHGSSTNIDKLGVASSDVTSCRCGPRAVTSQEATPTFSILVLELSCFFLHPSLQRDKLKYVCFNLVAQRVDLL